MLGKASHLIFFSLIRLVNLIIQEYSCKILINWTSPFPILGMSGVVFILILFSNSNSYKQTV